MCLSPANQLAIRLFLVSFLAMCEGGKQKKTTTITRMVTFHLRELLHQQPIRNGYQYRRTHLAPSSSASESIRNGRTNTDRFAKRTHIAKLTAVGSTGLLGWNGLLLEDCNWCGYFD